MPKKLFVLLSIVFISITSINAQTVFGKYAGEFMAIGIGGRPLGMGGAFVAVANDVTAGYYNPAGLANLNYPQISLMHSEQFGNLVNYDYAAVGIPFGTDMSFGLSVMRLGVDGIPDTRNALIDGQTGELINDINNIFARLDYSRITEFSNQDWAFYLTFAKRLSDKFYWGANIKIIRRDIAEFGATGIGFDLGAYYTPFENFHLGVNVQDITTTLVAWDTGRNELISPTLKLGSAYVITGFLGGYIMPVLDFDIRFENRQFASNFNLGPVSFDLHAGLEVNIENLVFIRGGYNDVKQFTVGAGVKLPKLNIDYSFARFSESEIDRLPDSHRISLILTLEEPKFLRSGVN
ncbi:MAG: PorV/PorQ family protein [Bacteroidetes bacterium]|nr:PorV/PorQ family protein [Bacteroidota bacterium]